ncbi:flagellar basal body P-ring formation chaperone FlgA [Tropicimonas sediminicola]|uniref:Flagella basal body P-ring formation protein FlgA n=1 Tax=Tropicimonas sediminicola TaxID=1031541 RepID=A0A239JCJ2_9RHOB|nr:flagellar basal body P-ring formation chaperone FlgA [Tropicimonas sediminicola]SNT03557.1 flagella basal body P-ring formation protein FlgA [Tropicimonas sediminicola]
MTGGLYRIMAMLALGAGPVASETLVATQTVRSQTVLSAADVMVVSGSVPGALEHPAAAIGMEARVVLYAGRPIRAEDIGPPALIERNAMITLVYQNGPLSITADGRSLARAAAGETVRAMNLASRATVTGTVDPDGRVIVRSTVQDAGTK